MEHNTEHKEIYLLMMDALDGKLEPGKMVQLDSHLARCLTCSQQWESIQVIHQLFLQAPLLSPAADFTQRTLSRLPSARQRIIALSIIYGLLLVSGLVPLGLLIWLASQIRPAVSQPAFVNGLLQGFEQILEIAETIFNAFLQVLGTFGVFLGQHPTVIGLLLVMLGTIFVWGGVFTQMTRQTRSATTH